MPGITAWMGSAPSRTRLLHQVDLHRRGVGAQQHRLGLAEVEVEGVVHAARRVGRGDVERLEVVPVGLGLGALGHREAHADEDVLELGPGLGHEVQVAPGRRGAHLGRGSPRSGRGGRPAARRRARPRPARPGGSASRRLEAGPDLVELAAGLLARLGLEPPSARWARVSAERLPRNSVSTWARASVDVARRDGLLAVAGDALDVEFHVVSHHVEPSPSPRRCYVPRAHHPGAGGTPRSRRRRRPRPR